jgi:hypothetical protein
MGDRGRNAETRHVFHLTDASVVLINRIDQLGAAFWGLGVAAWRNMIDEGVTPIGQGGARWCPGNL